MKPEIKQMWVDALRSGEYQQSQNYLQVVKSKSQPIGFCCLGVLCDLALKNGVEMDVKVASIDSLTTWTEYDGNSGDLPAEVMIWAGLTDPDPTIGDERERSAAGANDAGASFEEIADLIERNL